MRAKGRTALLVVGVASLWAQAVATRDAPPQNGIAGTWRVESTPPGTPWTAVFRVDGPRLIGAVSGCTCCGPSEIEGGSIDGNTVTFSCKSREAHAGVGNRILSLTGRVNGDEIAFEWTRRVREGGYPGGGPGQNDYPFRSADPPRFIAKRVPDGADELTTMADQARRAPAVSFDRIMNADREPQNWLTYSGTMRGWRHSPLTLVSRANVKDLELAWTWQTQSDAFPFVPTPLVVDGVMYTIQGSNDVVALDAATGSVLWTHSYTPAGAALASVRGGRPNRGLAILGHTLFLGTLDAHLRAIDAYSGKLIWSIKVADALDPACTGSPACYVITHAPLVVKDKVLVGVGGGDGSIRGFIAAFDATTGKEVWRFHTIPAPGEPGNETWSGDSWKTGGAGVWNAGSYDADLNLTHWGTGNPAPGFNASARLGDNLHSNSVVALDADTGKLRWHYQFTPHDDRDWDSAQVPVLADLTWQGRARKVLVVANKNGLMYVLDRTTGQFLMGKPYVDVNWMSGFDAAGRPIRVSVQATTVRPGSGATNWYPASDSSATGLLYVPATGPGFGAIRALDPTTGDRAWEFRLDGATFTSGVLTTASDLLFTGTSGGPLVDRYFHALDARTGEVLWRTAMPGSVRGSPMTYSVSGKQYIAVAAGNSVSAFALRR